MKECNVLRLFSRRMRVGEMADGAFAITLLSSYVIIGRIWFIQKRLITIMNPTDLK